MYMLDTMNSRLWINLRPPNETWKVRPSQLRQPNNAADAIPDAGMRLREIHLKCNFYSRRDAILRFTVSRSDPPAKMPRRQLRGASPLQSDQLRLQAPRLRPLLGGEHLQWICHEPRQLFAPALLAIAGDRLDEGSTGCNLHRREPLCSQGLPTSGHCTQPCVPNRQGEKTWHACDSWRKTSQ